MAAIGASLMAASFFCLIDSRMQEPCNFLTLAARNPHIAAKCHTRVR